jgi:hypothetical protein
MRIVAAVLIVLGALVVIAAIGETIEIFGQWMESAEWRQWGQPMRWLIMALLLAVIVEEKGIANAASYVALGLGLGVAVVCFRTAFLFWRQWGPHDLVAMVEVVSDFGSQNRYP